MIFHPLPQNLPQPELLNNPFCYEPDALTLRACHLLQAQLPPLPKEGKMYGVLVGEKNGRIGYLQAFSGQVEEVAEGFVPAVFDYLQPDGYFKIHEREISDINARIRNLQADEHYLQSKKNLAEVENEANDAIEAQKERVKKAKQLRDKRRMEGETTADEEAEMVRESQFLKAELHRTKLFYKQKLADAQAKVERFEAEITRLQRKRKLMSDQLQAWLFGNFMFLNANGAQKSLLSIFSDYAESSPSDGQTSSLVRQKTLQYRSQPPSGAGECCEPKLLQYAFIHQIKPLSMAMFWWGSSPKQEIRQHKQFYPACNGKCKPILSWMLQGLEAAPINVREPESIDIEVLNEDEDIAVVHKPAGLLSVPGKGKQLSVQTILQQKWAGKNSVYMVHRLDMDTSGLLVVAKNKAAYLHLQRQFLHRTVQKRYTALLPLHVLQAKHHEKGEIQLPLAPDFLDRPRQKVDYQNGLPCETRYEIVGKTHLPNDINTACTLVFLYPKTGRTHQLRVHCAHPQGLNAPIIGDNLYGTKADRLHLYADRLCFLHPTTLKKMEFHAPSPAKIIANNFVY